MSNRGYLLLYKIIELSKIVEYRNGKDVQGSLLIQCSVFCWCQNCTEYEEQIQKKQGDYWLLITAVITEILDSNLVQ